MDEEELYPGGLLRAGVYMRVPPLRTCVWSVAVCIRVCVSCVGTLMVGPATYVSRPSSAARVTGSAACYIFAQGTRRTDLMPGMDEVRVVMRPENGLGLLVHFASPSPQVCVVVVVVVVVGGGGWSWLWWCVGLTAVAVVRASGSGAGGDTCRVRQ